MFTTCPHFVTLPEPAPVNAEDALLRSRDAVSRNALKYVNLAHLCGSFLAGCVPCIDHFLKMVRLQTCLSLTCVQPS